MNYIEYFFWLAMNAFASPILFPPLIIPMLIGAIGLFISLLSVQISRRQFFLGAFLPLILPFAILLCGVVFHHVPNSGSDTAWAEWLIIGLLFAHLPLCVWQVAKLRDAWWFALCSSLLVFGYSCGAAFMSTMSVTGIWL